MSLVRKNILVLEPYISGKPIEETKRQFGLKEAVKLASHGERVVLVRSETSPDDIHGMSAA